MNTTPRPPARPGSVAAELDRITASLNERTPCSFPSCDTGPGEPCDRHEREWAHADGDHELCGAECPATAAGGAR
ncbi:hypothetical protein LUW77_03255 [Streptomyces radiopugnans]|nr:hypothetical protein LUW77_03255 [Streptomyces radiopugnans]